MIRITAKRGTNQVISNIRNTLPATESAIRTALYEIGAENARHLRNLINDKNKTGRIYYIHGIRHQASAPGEAPARLTGALANSADYAVSNHSQMEFGERMYYGKYLEDGTKGKDGRPRIAPRPHVSRTVIERGEQNRAVLKSCIDREINR